MRSVCLLSMAWLGPVLIACVVQDAGMGPLPPPAPTGFDGAVRSMRDAAVQPDAGAPPWLMADSGPPPVLQGDPQIVGCADGTREGFLDLSSRGWPDIAGCAGGFSVPGLVGPAPTSASCERQAGNSSANPNGVGCSAADLCASGWHVCQGPGEVADRSVSGCESIVSANVTAFFAAMGGTAPAGHCAPVPGAFNDVLGCGTFGQPGVGACFPLDRRLDIADCRASGGSWRCGDSQDHLREAAVVWKPNPHRGGVLCCRNP